MTDPTPPLRVAVLTRTGRSSGIHMARAIDASRHTLCGVLAEKRSSMIRRIASRKSLGAFLRQHGLRFLITRIMQATFRKTPAPLLPDAPYRVVDSLNSDEAITILNYWKPDLLVVANAPLLKPRIFQASRLGAVNFHSGRLPEYGGLESEFWAIYDGQKQAWATIHEVVEKLDSGGILREAPVDIAHDDNPDTLHQKLVDLGSLLVMEVLDEYATGTCRTRRHPGSAQLRPWPTPKQRSALRRRQHITS